MKNVDLHLGVQHGVVPIITKITTHIVEHEQELYALSYVSSNGHLLESDKEAQPLPETVQRWHAQIVRDALREEAE